MRLSAALGYIVGLHVILPRRPSVKRCEMLWMMTVGTPERMSALYVYFNSLTKAEALFSVVNILKILVTLIAVDHDSAAGVDGGYFFSCRFYVRVILAREDGHFPRGRQETARAGGSAKGSAPGLE